MPRNGDASSDNGPIDSHEIVHGTSGDVSFAHADNGNHKPDRNQATLQHTKHVAPMPSTEKDQARPGMNGKSTSGDQQSSSGTANSASSTMSGHGSHEQNERHDLEHVSREKAKRYVNLNEEHVDHARTPNSNNEDVELLHGKTALDSSKSGRQSSNATERLESAHGKDPMRHNAEKFVNLEE
ncbi:hypothetical protein ACEQ8H_006134 [Pleosporales sp. CAS-2024a]